MQQYWGTYMPNIHTLSIVESNAPKPDRLPYSFEMAQSVVDGMVLIDACVPAAMATAFLNMLIAFQCAAATKTLQTLTHST